MKQGLLVLLMVLIVSGIGHTEEKVVRAAGDPWPPYIQPNSPTEGLSLEIIRAAYKTQGYVVTMEYMPWARAEAGVTEGKYDILPNTWMTEKRKRTLQFSEPYAANQLKFIKKKGDSFEYLGMASLTGKTVGVILGYGYSDQFLNETHFRREEVVDFITNIRKLVAEKKRIDLTIEDELVAYHLLFEEDPALLTKIEFTQNALAENPLYVACGLANPRHQEIIAAFNRGLAEMKANGMYSEIYARYHIN